MKAFKIIAIIVAIISTLIFSNAIRLNDTNLTYISLIGYVVGIICLYISDKVFGGKDEKNIQISNNNNSRNKKKMAA